MIAELHGKISANATNLNDRREDQLTGDFFGTMRYIPYEKGLLQILESATITDPAFQGNYLNIVRSVNQSNYPHEVVEFWPKHPDAEIDVLISFPEVIIGIEVKYGSGLSSDDGMDNAEGEESEAQEAEESSHQLARESRMLAKIKGDRTAILLFMASASTASLIMSNAVSRRILSPAVKYGHLTWQQAYDVVEKLPALQELTPYESAVISDIRKLLKRKGFDTFKDFRNVGDICVDRQLFYSFKEDQQPLFSEGPVIKESEWYEFG